MAEALNLPSPCVVVLVGPGASGKSTWAAAQFPADTIVSSDRLRALVGTGEDDIEASTDAFVLLDEVVRRRLARRLTTVIDTLGLDAERRAGWLALARQSDMPCFAVAFDTSPGECRERNRKRGKRIPADVLTTQLRAWATTRDRLTDEAYDAVLEPEPVRVVPEAFVAATHAARRQEERPTGLRFGLHLGAFSFDGGTGETAKRLAEIASAAETAGFDAIYVMDHFRQIPQVGRAWDDFLESYTTLGYLAACTLRMRIGALVTGITYRNVAHLGKIVATLDVLSSGRAICGLGLAWFKEEHLAYGWQFPRRPSVMPCSRTRCSCFHCCGDRGTRRSRGRSSACPTPRVIRDRCRSRLPILVGGGGERRTLRLAARYADAANVFGDATTVRRKAEVLAGTLPHR